MQRRLAAVAAAWVFLSWAQTGAAQEPRFDSPVACPATFGCVVRNFVDMDPTPEAQDQNCGDLTYDGHKGMDIRVPDSNSLVRGVEVFAAARGTVLRLRDGMPDVSIRETGAEAVKDREAGNSVIIDHGNGWETQYGHLRQGSIMVRPGDVVRPARRSASSASPATPSSCTCISRSGTTASRSIPTPVSKMGGGCGETGHPLWTEVAQAQLPYRTDAPFDAGFATEKADFARPAPAPMPPIA